MANYTLSPEPYLHFEYADGTPVAAGQVFTYLAGTTTPATTYSTSSGTPNTNPIILDAAGNCSIYLAPGSYRYDVYDSVANGGALLAYLSKDNIQAVPTGSSDTDIDGIAGTAITAGQVVYLSDGSGALTAGRWYPAKADNAYSSTTPQIGFAVNDIASGVTGSIRLIGRVTTGLSVTVGLIYYISSSSAGAVTATAPALSRFVGMADSGTSLVIAPDPPQTPSVDNTICDGRLTLTTAVPVTTADVTGASAVTIFFSPYKGNRLTLYTGTRWEQVTFSEVSIAVPATTATVYDVFAFNNSGTLTLEVLAWTNDTTRATALVTQDGVLVKTGALTRRYLGSFRTTAVSGQTEDSFTKRHLWNYYNRVSRVLQRLETTASWTYSTATVRQANGSTSNQVDILVGFAEVMLDLGLQTAQPSNSNGGITVSNGIGEGSTTTYIVGAQIAVGVTGTTTATGGPVMLRLVKYPAVGRQFYSWNEWSTATPTTTWTAIASVGSNTTAGLTGFIEG